MKKTIFQPFKTNISGISLPEKFTFPFYYEPHELSRIATTELQSYLEKQTDFEHNFGLQENQEGLVIGKMFGVLVCQNEEGKLGYLWAFSGKLAGVNHLPYFVPTIFDMLHEDGFFRKEEDNTELGYNDLLKVIRDEFEEEISLGKISQSTYKNKTYKS